ncbi:nitroreductase family deazaflavin-dependent oxidoreductase [Nocardia stercoris]|uniref:Nitroreductase family deazaflavin-dependent oxidoreductase n=1 Tax=Nocardia stercoris TaxID=2483361 RepID=A0A3M2L0Q2_9NOCA|nr:nitroreductase family deazaflavin-dependent oxidoreductase [Nocardia stercoris]RMI30964.1 nitroreductase family deazaflavin-dependent oxidoreductase [Nocardia stercoris]
MASLFGKVLQVHQAIYEATDGLLGHRLLFGNPTLLLRTVGRKTGKPRTNALTYARDGEAYLVVASNGGAAKPPGWLANLKARPECVIQIGRRRIQATASIELPGDVEYARRWRIVNDNNHDRYDGYQAQTSRPIPVVVLRPRNPR